MATTYTDATVNLGDGDDDAVGDRNGQEQTINGNGGDDVLSFQFDQTHGSLYGGPGNDELHGGLGSDILDGGDGNDILYGGLSTYEFDPIDDFYGGPGNDIGFGYYGSDRFFGDEGSDCFYGDQGSDAIYGGDDNDKELGSLPAGRPGSFFTFTGLHGGPGNDYINGQDGNDDLFGDEDNDSLYGGSGDDTLDGGTGADKMTGGPGKDFYYVDNPGDRVIETDGGKEDAVFSTISYKLPANIENFALLGTGSINATGNGANNIIVGNDGRNTIKGLSGSDVVLADKGNDTLAGGTGRDKLYGEAGSDYFDFNSVREAGKGAARDRIMDFSRGQHDRIDLRDIDADTHGTGGNQKFHFIGTAKFHERDGELRCKNGIIQGDVNGDGKADLEIHVNVNSLKAGDFFL